MLWRGERMVRGVKFKAVVDTNVLALANGKASHLGPNEEAVAAKWLAASLSTSKYLVDTAGAVIEEYSKYASRSGQPGVGDIFFRSIFQQALVGYVDIGKTSDEVDECIPAKLRSFDQNDRKWLALFLKGQADHIVNATDSDYQNSISELSDEGIVVVELLKFQ